jgi:hypothetical protein
MPLKEKGIKKFENFDLAVSYRINETRDRLRDALNIFSNQGRLETRFGRSLYITDLFTDPVISMSFFKAANGNRYLLAKVGSDLYKVSTSGAHTIIKSGLSANTKHRGITWGRGASSRHIIAIENDGLFQWDGTTFTQLGQEPPVGHTVATTTGTLTGTYRVHLTFYSSTTGFESNSSFSTQVSPAAQGILVSDIPATAANLTIDKVRIYLEDMASPDDPLFVDEVALGTLTYPIAGEPTSSETRPLANAEPLAGGGKYLSEFNGKLVYAGNSNFRNDVYFSEPDLPDAFNDGTAPDRLVHYAKGAGPITGIAVGLYNNSVLDPYLVIFKYRSIEVYSEINGEGRAVTISREIGCVSHETITVKNGDIYFLSDSGFRVINNGRLVTDAKGNAATLGLGDIDDIFHQPGFTYEINKSQASNCFSVYYSTLDQYMTWIPEGGSTDRSKTYVYEFRVGGFKPYSFQSPSTAACIGEDADGAEVVFMADADGAIYTHSIKEVRGQDDDSTDTAQNVTAFGYLTWLEGPDMDRSHNWRELILKRVAGSGNMTVRAWVNYSLDYAGEQYDFSSDEEGFVLDTSELDVDVLTESGRTIEKARADINLCGENILIGFFQEAAGSNMGLVSAQVEFNTNGNRN